jgi:hypothetical protein
MVHYVEVVAVMLLKDFEGTVPSHWEYALAECDRPLK